MWDPTDLLVRQADVDLLVAAREDSKAGTATREQLLTAARVLMRLRLLNVIQFGLLIFKPLEDMRAFFVQASTIDAIAALKATAGFVANPWPGTAWGVGKAGAQGAAKAGALAGVWALQVLAIVAGVIFGFVLLGILLWVFLRAPQKAAAT